MMLQALVQPYDSRLLNVLDVCSLFILIITQVISILYLYLDTEADSLPFDMNRDTLEIGMTLLLFAVNISVLVILFAAYAVRLGYENLNEASLKIKMRRNARAKEEGKETDGRIAAADGDDDNVDDAVDGDNTRGVEMSVIARRMASESDLEGDDGVVVGSDNPLHKPRGRAKRATRAAVSGEGTAEELARENQRLRDELERMHAALSEEQPSAVHGLEVSARAVAATPCAGSAGGTSASRARRRERIEARQAERGT